MKTLIILSIRLVQSVLTICSGTIRCLEGIVKMANIVNSVYTLCHLKGNLLHILPCPPYLAGEE